MPRSNMRKALGTCPIEGQKGKTQLCGGHRKRLGRVGPGEAAPGNTQLPFCMEPCQTAWMLHARRELGSLPWPGDITFENNLETAPAGREPPANPSESHRQFLQFLLRGLIFSFFPFFSFLSRFGALC